MTDRELTDKIEAYLRGEMNAAELAAFERLRLEDASLDQQIAVHQEFMKQLNELGEQRQLKQQMEVIHSELDVETLRGQLQPSEPLVIRLWRKHRVNFAIASSVAIMAMLVTLFSTGYFSQKISSSYSALRREINSIKQSQNAIINNINQRPAPVNPGEFGGTGFAVSADGYILTAYHLVKGADSVYVQNQSGTAYKSRVIYVDPLVDVALIQIVDPAFSGFGPLPYTFKRSNSDLGEDVYTIGFPKDEPVYGRGYVSSRSGFAGDSLQYQVSIPVNPGNSGGPLLDGKGNVVGMISGKQTLVEGAAFAMKTRHLLKSIESIPSDSLDLNFSKKNQLSGLSRTEQIRRMQEYIFMVKVY